MAAIQIQTVTGPMPLHELGVCVTHEHVFLDSRDGFDPRPDRVAPDLKVSPETRPKVDLHPLAVLDNLLLDDLDVAVEELSQARSAGLATLVEATSLFTGREPARLVEASRRSGVRIVMGSGLYMERAIPENVRAYTEAELERLLDADFRDGVETPHGRVRPGVLGEVGVSAGFTDVERRSLRAAARVARLHGVPLSIHLPAWDMIGHAVLDEIEAATADIRGVLLGHLNPKAHDRNYMGSLAARGAWLGLDMMGNNLDYGEGRQSPDEETNVANLAGLIDAGLGDRVLLSSDVGQKNMLRRNGGQGYGHVIRMTLPSLVRRGVDEGRAQELAEANPRRWFAEAAGYPEASRSTNDRTSAAAPAG